MAVDLKNMKKAVSNMVTQAIYVRTQNQKVKRGLVQGGSVVIGNRVFPYTAAVDMYFSDGDVVWCLIPDGGRRAVVVGV